MAAFVKFQQFLEDLCKKVHDLDTDVLKVYLTNATPDVAADAVMADLAEISAGNGYTAGGITVTSVTCEHTTGTVKVVSGGSDPVWTAAGGTIGPFRYAVLVNDTPSSPADPLIGYWDYGSAITLQIGETFTVDLDGTNGIFTIA
jgi:hypothetical protein